MQKVSRLISEFVPDSYRLSLTIERVERRFSGILSMRGTSLNGKIIIHAKDLEIVTVQVDGHEATYLVGRNDEISITSPGQKSGIHIITISYRGKINDQLHGLYPCYYEHDGKKKELLITQLESHHAREVFPCIDEPEAKATFDIVVTTEQNISLLGNMPLISQVVENDLLVTHFDTSPRMSTYLVALVMGEMRSKTAKTTEGTDVSIWATPAHSSASLDFALDHAVKTIEYFNQYFGSPYPLPKSDHVAVPDFSSGAMENWGLITYRETALIADPTTASLSGKEYIATVIAHELSHQWFGNLVTMKWWDNLWLNESFATIMEYLAVDALHPDWNMWTEFSTNEGVLALRRDCIDQVQPVQIEVNHPDEITSIFDGAIVYAKGGRLMRMMQAYVGDSAFREGLNNYFNKYQYANTVGDDLWRELSKVSYKDVGSLMNTWIKQAGYPVVHASIDKQSLTLAQEQFFVGPHKKSSKIWPIPLGANNESIPNLLSETQIKVIYDSTKTLHLNSEDTGHFITHYDEILLGNLRKDIQTGIMPTLQRIQLLHEQTLLARGGVTSYADLIDLLNDFKNETDEKVWGMISLAISDLKKFVETDKQAEKNLRLFASRLARPLYEKLGWDKIENEAEDQTKLRATIIGCMIYGEDDQAIKHALELYESTDYRNLDPELRVIIMGAAVRHGTTSTIADSLLNDYQKTSSPDLMTDICSALTSTRDKKHIDKYISLLSNTDVIRTQDTIRWFIYLLRNRDSRQATWQWMQDNWQWIDNTFGSDKSYDYYPRYAASILNTRKQMESYRQFFEKHRSNPALTRTIDMGLLELDGRINLIETNYKQVAIRLSNL